MKIWNYVAAALAAGALVLGGSAHAADNYAVKDGAGASITICALDVAGVKSTCNVIKNAAGTTINPATSDLQTSANTKLDQLHTDAIAATPAGELHTGEVGGNQISVQVAQTVTASSAYAAGNAIGGKITIAGAARVSGSAGAPGTSGMVQSLIVSAKTAQTTQIDIFLFKADPSSSTITDKTAFVLHASDFDKVVGVIHLTDWTAGNTASIGQAQNLAIPYALASGTSLYAVAVTRSTPTFGSTSDISIGFGLLRN